MCIRDSARALLALDDEEQQYILANKIFDEKLSVRETEKLVPAAGLYPPPGELVPGHAQAGTVPAGREEKRIQTQALRADDVPRATGTGRCEGSAPQVYCRPGASPVPIYGY